MSDTPIVPVTSPTTDPVSASSDAVPVQQPPVVVTPPTGAPAPPVAAVPPAPLTEPAVPVSEVAPAAPVVAQDTSSVDDVLAEAIDIQQTFAANDQQPVQAPTVPATDPSVLPPVPPQADESVMEQQPVVDVEPTASSEPAASEEGENTKKSPLDILEEILGKQSGEAAGDEGAKTPEEPAVPEKTPEEIAAEQVRIAAEEQARLEAKRQEMLQEVTSTDQQQRDAIRINEMQSKQVDQLHDIYQIKRQRLPTTPTT